MTSANEEVLGERLEILRHKRASSRPQRHTATTLCGDHARVSSSEEEIEEDEDTCGKMAAETAHDDDDDEDITSTVIEPTLGRRLSHILSCSFPFWHLLTKGERKRLSSICVVISRMCEM